MKFISLHHDAIIVTVKTISNIIPAENYEGRYNAVPVPSKMLATSVHVYFVIPTNIGIL